MQPKGLNITFAHKNIQYTASYKYLGIEVGSTLNLNSYLDSIYKKSTSRLRILYKIRPFMNAKCAKTLYQSMILPLLTYCRTLQLKLDSFHQRALRVINCNETVPSAPVLNKIHALMLVQECLHGEVCSNFKDYFEIAKTCQKTCAILVIC